MRAIHYRYAEIDGQRLLRRRRDAIPGDAVQAVSSALTYPFRTGRTLRMAGGGPVTC
jgi:hypothetical protein